MLRGGVCRINADAFSTFLRAVQSLDLSLSLFPFFRFLPSPPFLRSLFNRATLGIATVARFGDDVYTFFFFSSFFSLYLSLFPHPSSSFSFCRAFPDIKKNRGGATSPRISQKLYPRLLNARVNVNNHNGLARLREREGRNEGTLACYQCGVS